MAGQVQKAAPRPPLAASSTFRATPLGAAAAALVFVPHEDDTDAHEDANKVDEQFRRVPHEVSVPLRGFFHDQLGVENYVPGNREEIWEKVQKK